MRTALEQPFTKQHRDDLAEKMPDLTARLAAMLDKLEQDGRSSP